MTLELIAIQWIVDGFKQKVPLLLLSGLMLLIFDVGSDLVGIPT